MDRRKEYLLLRQELDDMPQALEQTMARAMKKYKRKRYQHMMQSIAGLACMVAVMFVILVNTFPSFAYACGRVPLLRELAQAVAFSPSLTAAVDNQYVQPIEQEQHLDDVTARVEYVIVDQKQVNVFYTLNSSKYQALEAQITLTDENGEKLKGYGIFYSGGSYGKENGELHSCTIDFMDTPVPQRLRLTMAVHDHGSWEKTETVQSLEEDLLSDKDLSAEEGLFLGEMTFDLAFDPIYTAQGETIDVGQTVLIDNQKLTVTTAEIYPTHIRINFADDVDNTAWLTNLSFYLEDEKGNRFSAISNGISATGSLDSPMMISHRLESSYFANSEHLKLYITKVKWLEKDRQRVRLDLAHTTADNLPQGVRFVRAEQYQGGWVLTFWVKLDEPHHFYAVWQRDYYDEDGKLYGINQERSNIIMAEDDPSAEGYFEAIIPLQNYTQDSVYLSPTFSQVVDVEPAVCIEIK